MTSATFYARKEKYCNSVKLFIAKEGRCSTCNATESIELLNLTSHSTEIWISL